MFPNQDFMENLFFLQEIVNFSKNEVLTQNGVRPIKPLLSTQTNEKHNLGQKSLSQPRIDAKRIFYKKWLIFSKKEVWIQNGVRPSESLLSTKNNVKHSLGRKTLFST